MVNSNKYKRIAILSGGISDERDISIMSASAVYKTLKEHYITQLIDVDNNCLNLINKINFNLNQMLFLIVCMVSLEKMVKYNLY